MTRVIGRRALWTTALMLLGLLQVAWLIADVPVPLKLGSSALLMLAVARPALALLVWAGLSPLTTSIAGLAGAPLIGALLLEVSTLAVITGAVVRHTIPAPARLATPALWMGAVAVASGLAELPARLVTAIPDQARYPAIARLLFDHAIDRIPALDPWYFGLLVAEGAALAWAAEIIVRREPGTAARVVWCALLGHAGVAVLNISRVVGASLRGGNFPDSLPHLLLTVREHTQYDVNAAASTFILIVLAGFGLFHTRAWRSTAVAAALVSVAVWVTGSRTAVVALLATLTITLGLRARRTARGVALAAAAVLVSVGVLAWMATAYPSKRNLNVPASVSSRLVMFKTAINMAWEAPVVGIGTGTFLQESPHYGATGLQPILKRSRDNAHNYFLQTVAEQGVLGLIALLAMLVAALWPTLRAAYRSDPIATWLAAGIVASLLTWLSGHPLLEPEAALVFWLFVGVLAGTSRPPTVRPALQRLAAIAIVTVLASVPFRAIAEERAADLEHLAVGVSAWQPAVDGERFRAAGAEFALFLPSGATMTLPVRSATPADVTIELRSGPRLIDAVVAERGLWKPVRIVTPESASRYVRIDFRAVGASGQLVPCDGCLWVGKAVTIASPPPPPEGR